MIPLSQHTTLSPNHFTKTGSLNPNTLKHATHTWFPMMVHQSLLGFFTADIQHKTELKIIPIISYILEDITRPQNLLSYPALTYRWVPVKPYSS